MRQETITKEDWAKLEELYGHDIPEYLEIKNEKLVVIKASQWEGADLQEVKVTPKDVIQYYRQDNSMGCGGMSGCRTLSDFTTDWRMVDNMAKECLEIFKILNKEALAKEGKKFGMELKE